ncbi:beta-amyrin 11-oxidase-like [Lycium barbarum]|uniref:beta-amyrin 11-oxidase-like n=1 Tax=Lycium barbarum TaxID=112863 RepID=UPI00293F7894|nr:beta-amyrin 11-oxidase-like [Lycium barbarum]
MEYDLVFFSTAFAVGVLTLISVLKRANGWYYSFKFSSEKCRLPPGDMGWPVVGNMLYFVKCLSAYDLKSFVSYFVTRFGAGGMYRTFMFGKPSVIVTTPELCRKILMDDENFDLGFPKYILELLRKEPIGGTSQQEDRLARRLTTPIKSHGLVSFFFDFLSETVKTTFEKWANTGEELKLLFEMKKPTFKVLMQVLIGGDQVADELLDVLFKENNLRFAGLRSLPLDFPGFTYNRAMKGRGEIVKIYQRIINERKVMIAKNREAPKTNILDIMLDNQYDEEGKGLNDENIMKVLLWYTFSGYESVAKVATQTIMLLEKHPECLQKAKEEQEEIVKRRASPDAGLSFSEIGQMKYVGNVINETLRLGSTETVLFRDARTTVNINGYTIPKGWKVLALLGNLYMNPKTYVKPKEFNPSRWDDFETKPNSFIPFGIGLRLCPGSNLVRLEVSVFLHYFLLNYRLEQLNKDSKPETCIARLKKISA